KRDCPLPTCLPHAGNHALQRQFSKHDPADAELAVHAAGAAGDLAPVAFAGGELGLLIHAGEYAFTCHIAEFRRVIPRRASVSLSLRFPVSFTAVRASRRACPVREAQTCSFPAWNFQTPR